MLPCTNGNLLPPSPYSDIADLMMSLTSWLPILCAQSPGQQIATSEPKQVVVKKRGKRR